MVIVGSVRDIKLVVNKYKIDEVWAIVRSNQRLTLETGCGVPLYHIPELSPSWDLFKKYLSWSDSGQWNQQCFNDKYKPEFLKEMHGDTARLRLKQLVNNAKDKNIMIVCFCKDYNICHRSIVNEILQEMGAKTMVIDTQPFYLLVAGSRCYNQSFFKEMTLKLDTMLVNRTHHQPIVIVSGGAKGIDKMAEDYAKLRGFESKVFPAEWSKYGKSAGFKRNKVMHEFIAANSTESNRGVICFWDGQSKGTADNFNLSKQYHTPLRIYHVETHQFITLRK